MISLAIRILLITVAVADPNRDLVKTMECQEGQEIKVLRRIPFYWPRKTLDDGLYCSLLVAKCVSGLDKTLCEYHRLPFCVKK